jgi:hypothetical protein
MPHETAAVAAVFFLIVTKMHAKQDPVTYAGSIPRRSNGPPILLPGVGPLPH